MIFDHLVEPNQQSSLRMPKATLTTKTAVDEIPHPEKGQLVYWDTELTGFGVLAGARQKTFVLERRINGKPRRVTLGRVGQITLQKARRTPSN